jgi:glutamyl-tRNA reductase
VTTSGIVSGVSIAHTDATIDQLERISIETQQTGVSDLRAEGASEAFVLQTCNRVEAYVVTEDAEDGRSLLDDLVADVSDEIVEAFGHEESLRHLLRVAAGLESLVIGEDQILGQVRDAYEDARRADGIGPVLEEAVTKAIRVGERARTETAINEGVVSLASAAVKLAAETHGVTDRTALVIGAGEMGTLAAKRLADRVDELILANRTVESAESVTRRIGETSSELQIADLSDAANALPRADVVIAATGSSTPVLSAAAFEAIDETFVVDITRPRDIPPAVDDFSHLTVYDLDKLEAVTEKTKQRRREAATAVREIVDEEFERLLTQYKRQRADQVISAMYESAERVKATELERSLAQLDLDEESEAVVESMADAIVSQLLASPTNSLRDAAEADDWSTIHTALQLFNPNFGPESDAISPEFVSELAVDEIPDDAIEGISDGKERSE